MISNNIFVPIGVLISKGIFGLKDDSSLKGLRNPKGIANGLKELENFPGQNILIIYIYIYIYSFF